VNIIDRGRRHEGRASPDHAVDDGNVPIIQLWHVLLVVIQGDLLDGQAERLKGNVLATIERTAARSLVVDVSGVWMMDSHLCMVVAHIARAARLMGCRTIVSGMGPEIAQTLQAMGLHLGPGRTVRSLEEALSALGIAPSDELDPEAERRALLRTMLDGDDDAADPRSSKPTAEKVGAPR
jgi:rsbT antagonist protein RsbS